MPVAATTGSLTRLEPALSVEAGLEAYPAEQVLSGEAGVSAAFLKPAPSVAAGLGAYPAVQAHSSIRYRPDKFGSGGESQWHASCDFALQLIDLHGYGGLIEYWRQVGTDALTCDPGCALAGCLETYPKKELIEFAVQGGVAHKRKKPKEDIAAALMYAAEKAWKCERDGVGLE